MYRTLLGVVAALLVALALVGLSFSSSTHGRPDFRFVNGSEAASLDPHLLTGQPEGRLALAVFEGLTRTDAKTLLPAPGMAERWDVSEDQTEYVFHIRKEARWTDGTPVTARDFAYSFERALSPATGCEYAYILYMIRHAEAFNTYEGRSQALLTTVPEALAKLGEVTGANWQSFLSEHRVHDHAKGAPEPIIAELLRLKDTGPSLQQRALFTEALKHYGKRLQKEFLLAKERFGKTEGMYARNDHEFVVQLNAPTAYFLEIMAFYTALPVPRWVVEKPGNANDWFIPGKLVSNGPFRIESWVVNDRVRLVKNESYWGKGRVKVESLEALALENSTTALNLYLTGEVDWLPSTYPTDLVDQLKTRPDFYKNPGWVTYFYRFNTERAPFKDRRVRQAINLAVDRQLLVDQVLRLGQLPAHHFVPPGVAGYPRPSTQIGFDVKRAQALLAEAGYPGGAGIEEIGVLYNTNESHKKIAEFIADQLRRNLGIRIKAYNQEWQSFLQTTRSMDFEMARAGWVGDYLDPNTFLDMWITNGGNNQTGFSSSKYDLLLRSAANIVQALTDPSPLREAVHDKTRFDQLLSEVQAAVGPSRVAKLSELRLSLLAEAERILVHDEFPVLPVYFYVVSGLVRENVGGFYSELEFPDGSKAPNVTDHHPLDEIFKRGTP